MKKFLTSCAVLLCTNTIAQTTNWYVDGEIYQTTTCESGDSVTPPTPPTKYGYTFQWWYDTSVIEGRYTQNGTPDPTNPVYPNFYQNGDLILRAVGTGDNRVFDTYNINTGIITRRVGVKVLDGSYVFSIIKQVGDYTLFAGNVLSTYTDTAQFICSHFSYRWQWATVSQESVMTNVHVGASRNTLNIWVSNQIATNGAEFSTWLAEQYANGTPVTVYYQLATPFTENYTPASNQ